MGSNSSGFLRWFSLGNDRGADTDCVADDAGAIMLAVPYPALGLSAVTTVNGNVPFGSGPRA